MLSISGIGIVSNLGFELSEVMSNLLNFESKRERILREICFESSQEEGSSIYSFPILLEDNDLKGILRQGAHSKAINKATRAELFSGIAIANALKDAEGILDTILPEKIGLFCGSSQASTTKLEEFYRLYKLHMKVKPSYLLYGGYGSINAFIANLFNIQGPRFTVSTACSSSLSIMQVIFDLFESNKIEAAVVYGVDSISELVAAGFFSLGAIALEGTRPFSIGGEGMSLGEGAAALVLTKKEINRYGYLVQHHNTSDAWHITSPEPRGKGAFRAMQKAMSSQDIDLICAHGTGTFSNDMSESHAIHEISSSTDTPPLVLSMKGAFGHTLGAAGVVNIVSTLLFMKDRKLPRSPGFISLRETPQINISQENTQADINTSLVNAFGFGGNNSSILITRQKNGKQSYYPEENKKIYITGIGCACAGGLNFTAFQNVLKDLKTGNKKITETGTLSFSKRRKSLGAYVLSDDEWFLVERSLISRKNFPKMDKISKITSYSVLEALRLAKLRLNSQTNNKLNVFWATGSGPMETIHAFYDSVLNEGFSKGEPALFPNATMLTAIGYASIEAKIEGAVLLSADDDISSSNALQSAYHSLKLHKCQYAIAGGAEEYSECLEKGYLEIKHITSEQFPDEGYSLAEGGVALLMEASIPKREGTQVYGEYLYGEQIALSSPGRNEYPQDVAPYVERVKQIIMDYGSPDLVITNHKGLLKHDNFLDKVICELGLEDFIFKPYLHFGYYLGSSTAFGILCGLGFFNQQQEGIDKQYKTIFLLTSSPGGSLNIDAIRDTEYA